MRRSLSTLTVLTIALALPGGVALAQESSSDASPTAEKAAVDLIDRIRALPGVISVTERSAVEGYRHFSIDFEQPVDHKNPDGASFTQRVGLMHKDFSRPMVMHTSGYGLPGFYRAEPTQIVDGNQLNMEYRFFNSSRPENPDWEKQLTIWQAASDQHRIIQSFKKLYRENWLTTGASKGGMTATYHRRFYPQDVSGTIPYVAPNDVRDHQDVYNSFLDRVGGPEVAGCRADLVGLQRRVLGADRQWFLDRLGQDDARYGYTYETVGDREKAFEAAATDAYWAFWQYSTVADCASLPKPSDTNEQVYSWFSRVSPLVTYADQSVGRYTPYYFQAAYQLGSPETYEKHLGDLLKFPGANVARTFVPDELKPSVFDKKAMPDIDKWVRKAATQMLYIDGQNDPWSAEPFNCGPQGARKRDCYRYVVPGGNHSSDIASLPEKQRNTATYQVLEWAGLTESDQAVQRIKKAGKPKDLGKIDRQIQREGIGVR